MQCISLQTSFICEIVVFTGKQFEPGCLKVIDIALIELSPTKISTFTIHFQATFVENIVDVSFERDSQ